MSTGIYALDKLIGGYKRGELVCIMGGYKGKKSWSLLHIAKIAVEQGLNAIYISHELSAEELEERLDMMLTHKASEDKYINTIVESPIYDPRDKQIYIQPYKCKHVDENKDLIKKKRKEWASLNGGNFKIKKFPMGKCSVEQMENYLDYLEQYHDFIPDVVITDYLEKMDISKYDKDSRHQIDQGYIKLKGIADERQIVLFTASQVTTEALSKEKIIMQNLAEDKRKAGNVDLLLAVSGTEEQDRAGISRMTVVATRSRGDQGEYCMFSHCIPLGQFAVSSWFGDDLTREAFAAFGEN